MSAQEKKSKGDIVANRLRRYQVSAGLPWRRVAERLGVSLSMIMMVLRGDRNLSARALFRLEEAEQEIGGQRSSAEQFVEALIGGRGIVDEVLGRSRRGQGTADIAVDYVEGGARPKLPVAISLQAPSEEACRRLRSLFAETLDTRLIALACLPEQLRTDDYLALLTAETRARVTNAALGLVIPDWRTLALRGAVGPTAKE